MWNFEAKLFKKQYGYFCGRYVIHHDRGCIVYHKTGNTIEVTTGEVADSVRRLSRRRGFGTMTCMGGKKSEVYNPRGMKNKLRAF